ncbi:MAG: serine protease [Planctomycetes bacterium]|nr:serine protease [Planctomycetota bacterium]
MKNTLTGCWAFVLMLSLGIFQPLGLLATETDPVPQSTSWINVVRTVQDKVVKIYGAGGVPGLESYQTGIIISPEGHILTAWSTVLDADMVTVVTTQGQRFEAKILGMDPKLEIAVLKADTSNLPFFSLKDLPKPDVGARVLAVSNLFGIATGNEAPSVQKGSLLAMSDLKERRGKSGVIYQGPIYVIDAMTNNPGAAGGALTDWKGNLVGLIGKELRDPQSNFWLNYAIPITELQDSIQAIIEGKTVASKNEMAVVENPHELIQLGIVLVPDVLSKTPAYIDRVLPDSPAAKAGLMVDDLIIMVGNQRIDAQNRLRTILQSISQDDALDLMIQRGSEIVPVKLRQE